MEQIKSITQQLLEATEMRLKWANQEQTRLRIIIWAYKYQKGSVYLNDFEAYMKIMPIERIQTYYRNEDALEFWHKFLIIFEWYEKYDDDITWTDYLETIEEKL
ncbi:MAG: hypothetical protein EBR82_88150 [Caulobacteraceae bacterium]|nr:hypothetical protein [Caulobacteraceae bacterium]